MAPLVSPTVTPNLGAGAVIAAASVLCSAVENNKNVGRFGNVPTLLRKQVLICDGA